MTLPSVVVLGDLIVLGGLLQQPREAVNDLGQLVAYRRDVFAQCQQWLRRAEGTLAARAAIADPREDLPKVLIMRMRIPAKRSC